jgi:tRNA A-37 threonylcarbamoyl transferase component Bud32
MIEFLKDFYFPSQLLTDNDFNKMCVGGKVLEQDERGVKVIQLTNGEILKIFRVRRWFSGARVYSHARRFCRNALRLRLLDIPTVNVKSLFHLEKSGHSAVLYQPLAGETFRHLVRHDLGRIQTANITFGLFLADLHKKGIHFHSLHTGNILLLPNNQFGLIDISDMTIYPWSLGCSTRIRSFKRLCKYQTDFEVLGKMYWKTMMQAYINASNCSYACVNKLLGFRD